MVIPWSPDELERETELFEAGAGSVVLDRAKTDPAKASVLSLNSSQDRLSDTTASVADLRGGTYTPSEFDPKQPLAETAPADRTTLRAVVPKNRFPNGYIA